MTVTMREREYVTDNIDLEGNSAIQLSVSATASETGLLISGVYDVISSVDCFIKVDGILASDVTTTTGYPLKANNMVSVKISNNRYFGAVSASAGTVTLHRIAGAS